MRKFLIFCVLLVSIFIFNTNKVYAMQNTSIIINYNEPNFETMYSSTLIEKLESLKETIDTYNINNMNYVISVRNDYVNVALDIAYTGQQANYCSDYYILYIQPSIVSNSQYYLESMLRKGYCSNNQNQSISSYNITMSDFMNDNTSTFLNNIQTRLNRGYGSDFSTLIPQNSQWGYDSDWANLAYIDLYYVQKPRNGNQYNYWIYYSSKPVYFSNISVSNNGTKIEDLCNSTIPSNYWTQAKFYYVGDQATELTCGQQFKTYNEERNQQPTWEEIDSQVNWNYQIKAYDTYYVINDTGKGKIEFTQDNYLQSSEISSIKYYGFKCENDTCYWDNLPYNTNLVSITNDTYERTTNGYTYTFNYSVDMGTYEKIKISFNILPKANTTYEIKYSTTSQNYNLIETDMNTIDSSYSLNTFIIAPRTYESLLVNSKDSDILYWFYGKYGQEYSNGNLLTYKWNKQTNIVETMIQFNEIQIRHYWLTIGNIQLGPNEENMLYMYLIGSNNATWYHRLYFSDKVIFTKSKTNVFNQTYNGTDTQYIASQLPSMVQSDMKNAEPDDLSGLAEIVEEYKQYNGQWLELFDSIYTPMPTILKHILIIVYTLLHCYAVFLIFKD